MDKDETDNAGPHEHSKYMPPSEDTADRPASVKNSNGTKLKLAVEATKSLQEDNAQSNQQISTSISPVTSSNGICKYHSESDAAYSCFKCKGAICNVCAFIHPDDPLLALCPECVSKPLDLYPTARKNGLIIAYVMAIISTLGACIMFSGILASSGMSDNAAGLIIMASILLPALFGCSFSYGIIDKNRGNGVMVWLALGWNALLLAGMTALIFIGNFVS